MAGHDSAAPDARAPWVCDRGRDRFRLAICSILSAIAACDTKTTRVADNAPSEWRLNELRGNSCISFAAGLNGGCSPNYIVGAAIRSVGVLCASLARVSPSELMMWSNIDINAPRRRSHARGAVAALMLLTLMV